MLSIVYSNATKLRHHIEEPLGLGTKDFVVDSQTLPLVDLSLLTLSEHAREGYSSYFFCVSVCLSQTDFEDGSLLSLQTGIKARQVTV